MLLSNGSIKDPAQLRPLYRATTNRQYADAATGDDANNGDVGSPLLTLGEAVARVPENYVGFYEIQCVGVGPYTLPVHHPRAAPNSALAIYADRSSPLVSNAAPSFTVVPGRQVQGIDPNFGAHTGFADGTHWLDWDISSFGIATTSVGLVCRASVSPALTVLAIAVSTQADVHPFTTLLQIPEAYNGGADTPLPDLSQGINYYGFSIPTIGITTAKVYNLSFQACLFSTGRVDFFGCSVGGYYNQLQIIDLADSSMNGMHIGPLAPSGAVRISGPTDTSLVNSVLENQVSLQVGARIGFFNNVDIEAGNGLDCAAGSYVDIGGNGISAYGVRLIRSAGTVRDFGGAVAEMLGAVSGNIIELIDGGRMHNITPARWTAITAGGSEIVVGANPGTTMTLAAAGTNDLGAATPQGCFSS